MQLNCSHWGFPWGWCGIVRDYFTPYNLNGYLVLHTWETMILAVVSAFWSHVANTWMSLVNTSVMTSFSSFSIHCNHLLWASGQEWSLGCLNLFLQHTPVTYFYPLLNIPTHIHLKACLSQQVNAFQFLDVLFACVHFWEPVPWDSLASVADDRFQCEYLQTLCTKVHLSLVVTTTVSTKSGIGESSFPVQSISFVYLRAFSKLSSVWDSWKLWSSALEYSRRVGVLSWAALLTPVSQRHLTVWAYNTQHLLSIDLDLEKSRAVPELCLRVLHMATHPSYSASSLSVSGSPFVGCWERASATVLHLPRWYFTSKSDSANWATHHCWMAS